MEPVAVVAGEHPVVVAHQLPLLVLEEKPSH
jgi:hypothetical protein